MAARAESGFKEIRELAACSEYRGIVARQTEFGDKPTLFCLGQFREGLLYLLDERLAQFQRQQIGIWEIAVIVRLFFAAHRARLVVVSVIKPGLLHDCPPRFEDRDLACDLIIDRFL